jgi:EmrB/QacA subfamily drug resistance transporter
MVVLDATIVTVALPSIQTGLHFKSQLDLEWVINVYILLFGGFLLLGGRAGDLFGRQRLFVAGLIVFSVASLINGVAQSPGMLIAGRAAQGVGAALVSPAVLSIIIVTFESAHHRAKALGYFSAVTASGGGVGLLLGGLLTDYVSWRAIFLVNVPIGILAVIGAVRTVPNSKMKVGNGGIAGMDIPGAVTVTAGLTLLVYAIVNASTWGWGSARVIWLIAASAVLLAAFLVIEKRTRAPLIRLGIFASRSLTMSNIVMFLFMGGMYVMLFFPTLYLAQIKGDSPIKIGLSYLPWPAAMAVAAGMGQQLMRRAGAKITLIVGLAFITAGLLLLSNLHADSSYAAGILPGMLLTAIGAGFAWATLFMVASAGVSAEESGLASGIINTSQQVGAALGLAVLSSIAASHTSGLLGHITGTATQAQQNHALVSGFQRGFLLGGILVAVAAVVAAVGVRKSDVHQQAAGAATEDVSVSEEVEAELTEIPATM